ncbi:alkaline-phosphatase-like protein [Fusarium sp. MPI-SDFR-AT-0072]|nr:alkaline-phosphatase-like protein [Fusarium sp. MPI-SDFR-AT-0072]
MRRSHTKSRKGCTNCKRRKFKCDEVYPICFNCKRHQTTCSLSEQTLDSPDQSSQSPAATHKSEEQETAARCGHASPAKASLAEQIASFPSLELWRSDIELMHHWNTIAADSLSVRPDICHIWRITIPCEGYRHLFVMHGILALSAIHKSFLLPQDRKRYRALSDYHQVVGSERFRSALQSIDSENSMALFGDYQMTSKRSNAWLGELLQLFEDHGIANETLVVLIGDHGQAFRDDIYTRTGTYKNGHVSNFRVPITFRHSHIPRVQYEANATLISILPTILDLLTNTGSLNRKDTVIASDLIHYYEGQSLIRPYKISQNGRRVWNFGVVNSGASMLSVTSADAPRRLAIPPELGWWGA